MTDDDTVDDEVGSLGVQTLINGKPPTALDGRPCEHLAASVQAVVGFIHENEDGTGPVQRRELLVKARCAECGVPFQLDATTVRQSSTVGERGVVVVLEPAEE